MINLDLAMKSSQCSMGSCRVVSLKDTQITARLGLDLALLTSSDLRSDCSTWPIVLVNYSCCVAPELPIHWWIFFPIVSPQSTRFSRDHVVYLWIPLLSSFTNKCNDEFRTTLIRRSIHHVTDNAECWVVRCRLGKVLYTRPGRLRLGMAACTLHNRNPMMSPGTKSCSLKIQIGVSTISWR
jgi:hypothetical protein